MDGFLENLQWDAGEFEIELISGDAFAGAAQFEVHVAEMVLASDDVEQRLVALEISGLIELGDESA